MLDRGHRMNRRRLGTIRMAAIVVGFACLVHFTHRECAKNTDRPARDKAITQVSMAKDDAGTPVRSAKGPEVFHATAYNLSGTTTAGVPAAPGFVAADPDVIPLGSMIYVETPFRSGVYQVMDTGELIKGKIIDIFIPSYEACVEFGRRMVKVKVLRYGFKDDPPATKTQKQ